MKQEREREKKKTLKYMCIIATVLTPAMPFCHAQLVSHPAFAYPITFDGKISVMFQWLSNWMNVLVKLNTN